MSVKELVDALNRIDSEGSAPVLIFNGSEEVHVDVITAAWTKGQLSSVVLS